MTTQVQTPTSDPVELHTFEAAEQLARAAADSLADARARMQTLHQPGQRERYRLLLAGAIEQGRGALAAATSEAHPAHAEAGEAAQGLRAALTSARATLAAAYAAKAEDALHGAGQLSLSAQRAPTRAACDDGWESVEEIVAGAEAAAGACALVARELALAAPGSVAARHAELAAQKAGVAARAARRIVIERNHAYTFHTDGRFSFGEGWYLAAAAVLAGVAIQLERGDGTLQAETFLHEAGLSVQLRPYRSRPRAMKQVTEIVGQVFRADPTAAQRRLRAAFLGDAPIAESVSTWIDRRLEAMPRGKKVLLWIRDGVHQPARNTALSELLELTRLVQQAGLTPILTGDALRGGELPAGAIDLILFWKDPLFRRADSRRAQLQFFEHLRQAHALIGQLGVTTAGMDGPALMGLPTLYLTDAPNVRMREWVGAVPEYRELVRGPGYFEEIARALRGWAMET